MGNIKNIAIVGADPYNGNRGVGALAYSTFFLIDYISKRTKYSFNIFVIVDSLYSTEDNFIIGESNIKVSFIRHHNLFSFRGLIRCFLSPIEINIYLKLDYILDISAGDSFSDIYGKGRFRFINSSKRFFRFLHKKQILLPQTIGPFKDSKIKKQAIRSIERSEIVFARDKQSYEYVLGNTSQKNIHELIDVAFFMPYIKKEFNKNYVNVGINISALLWNGGYNRNNQFNLKLDYQNTVKKIIEYFLQRDNVKLHLVPHVVSINSTIENDYEVSQKLTEFYKDDKLILSPLFLNPIDAKSYIGGLDFFIGARMHACIAAFSTGVPVYPMAYSRKFNGLFEDTLGYKFMGDMVQQGEEEILKDIKGNFENRFQMKGIIEERMTGIVADRYKLMMKLLEDFLIL